MAGIIFDGKTVSPAILVEKEIEKTKFGASIDSFLGDVDENGVLQVPTEPFSLNLTGVETIDDGALRAIFGYDVKVTEFVCSAQRINNSGLSETFRYNKNLLKATLSSLTHVGAYGMDKTFYNATNLEEIDVGNIETIEDYGMRESFYGADKITSLNLGKVKTIGVSGLQSALGANPNLESINLNSLTTVGSSALQAMFGSLVSRNTKLSKIYFPSLISVKNNSFGSYSSNFMFYYCTAMDEIHFRADMQATIEAMTGYDTKWGATNATIYFDL